MGTEDYIQIAILAAIVVQGGIAIVLFWNQHKLENARATMSALHAIGESITKAEIAALKLVRENPKPFNELTSDERYQVYQYLDHFEEISVAVNLGLYDLKIVNRTMGSQITKATVEFAHVIDGANKAHGTNSYYSDLLALSNKIMLIRITRPVNDEVEDESKNFISRYIRKNKVWANPKGNDRK